ncbi:hypothetical protein, partial [Halomicronema sp. CCY15110]|uniref:hypothetical protein n=1 Tax=Halomicronema sp. CCY15110 TaxID=2767773 RepID=UPI00194E7331
TDGSPSQSENLATSILSGLFCTTKEFLVSYPRTFQTHYYDFCIPQNNFQKAKWQDQTLVIYYIIDSQSCPSHQLSLKGMKSVISVF